MDTNELSEILTFCKQTLKEEFTTILTANPYSKHPQYYWMLAYSLASIFNQKNPYHIKVLDLVCSVLGDVTKKYDVKQKRNWIYRILSTWECNNNLIMLDLQTSNNKQNIPIGVLNNLRESNKHAKFYKIKNVCEYKKYDYPEQKIIKIGCIHVKNKKEPLLFKTNSGIWEQTNSQKLSQQYITYRPPTLFQFLKDSYKDILNQELLNPWYTKEYWYNKWDIVTDYCNLNNITISKTQMDLLTLFNLSALESINMIESEKQTYDTETTLPTFDFD